MYMVVVRVKSSTTMMYERKAGKSFLDGLVYWNLNYCEVGKVQRDYT